MIAIAPIATERKAAATEHSHTLSPRPGNFVSAQTSAKSDQDLLKIIANGRPRTAMQGWKDRLSEKEQLVTLAYIRSLVRFSRPATTPPLIR